MGKGSRNRENRIVDGLESENVGVKLSKMQLIKQQKKKEKTKKIITSVIAVVILIGIIVGVVAMNQSRTPKLVGVISATSQAYELDNAMMAYFLYSQYNTFVNNNYYYLSYYGLNPNLSLKQQNFSTNMTWFSYFMRAAKLQVKELVAMATEAQNQGVALDEEELKEIDDYLAELKADSQIKSTYGSLKNYLSAIYAPGVTEDTVRKCIRLQELAAKYYEQLIESFEYTDEEMNKYVEDNPESFYKFDYIYYDFDPETKTGATADEKKAALEAAKKAAEEFLAKVTDEASFKNLIVELEKKAEEEAETTGTTTTGTSTGTGSDTEKTDEDYLKNFIKESQAYKADSDFGKWAFENDRKDGDFKLIENTKKSTVDGKEVTEVTGYTVYFLTKAKYVDDYATKDVRHILFTKTKYGTDDAAKKKAEEVLAEFNKGEKTAEAFGELAKKYTEDSNGDKGGLYENVTKGYMVTEFNDWMYDEERQVGDTEIIKTKYGYHIMYHEGDGEIAWKLSAKDGLKAEEYESYLKELQEKETHAVTFNDKLLAVIP